MQSSRRGTDRACTKMFSRSSRPTPRTKHRRFLRRRTARTAGCLEHLLGLAVRKRQQQRLGDQPLRDPSARHDVTSAG